MSEAGKNWVLMTVELGDRAPTLDKVAEVSGLPLAELDQAYGVVPIDRIKGLFAVQVQEAALANVKEPASDVKGPFSNPRIEPFK